MIAYHVVPASRPVQDALCDGLGGSVDTLGQLVTNLLALVPELRDTLLALLGEFF